MAPASRTATASFLGGRRLQIGLHASLLLALCLRVCLALFFRDASSLDPTHGHRVLGALSAGEAAASLAAHEHAPAFAHWHDPLSSRSLPLEADGPARTVSFLSHIDSVFAALLLLGLPAASVFDLGGLLKPGRLTRRDLGQASYAAVRTFRPPVPPPRLDNIKLL